MRLLYHFTSAVLFFKCSLAATLTVTETQIVPQPETTSDTALDIDVFVTTTIFSYTSTPTPLPKLNLEDNDSIKKLPRKGPSAGGIDLIPIHQSPVDQNKDQSIEVGYDKNYFESHLIDKSAIDSNENKVQAFSPYHLLPGYKGSESKEEQAKVFTNLTVTQTETSTDTATTTTTTTASSPIPELHESPRNNGYNVLVDFGTPRVSFPGIEETDDPFAYDEDAEQSFWSSPNVVDNHTSDSILKWERLPDDETLEGLVKEPYKGLEPGEKLSHPVKKIMTDHLPPQLPRPTSTTTSSNISTEASSPSFTGTDTATETGSSKGKQVRLGEEGKSLLEGNGTTTGSLSESPAIKLLNERKLKLMKLKILQQEKMSKGWKATGSRKQRVSDASRRKKSLKVVVQKNWSTKIHVPAARLLGALVVLSLLVW